MRVPSGFDFTYWFYLSSSFFVHRPRHNHSSTLFHLLILIHSSPVSITFLISLFSFISLVFTALKTFVSQFSQIYEIQGILKVKFCLFRYWRSFWTGVRRILPETQSLKIFMNLMYLRPMFQRTFVKSNFVNCIPHMKKQRFWCQVFKRCSFIIRIYMLEKLRVAKFQKIINLRWKQVFWIVRRIHSEFAQVDNLLWY